jgi:DNA-binding CsgD family transcriptional regulator
VGDLGLPGFEQRLLDRLRAVVPAASVSVYRTGPRPALFFSGSLDVPDTTRDCWRAYLSGPHRQDRSLHAALPARETTQPVVCHITAGEVPPEHRARIYEAHGMAERVSVVQRDTQVEDGVFAINFYRHAHQRAFDDAQLASFGDLAPALLAFTRKHIALAGLAPQAGVPALPAAAFPRARLQALCPALTPRELDVCERLLRGMTQEGVAADLGLGLPTVKTYRNRAFNRLGIHFRSELSALLLQ